MSTSSGEETNVDRRLTAFDRLRQAIRLTVIVIHNLYHIPAYLLITWILLYPLYRLRPQLYWTIENYLYNWCLYTVSSWSWTNDVKVIECGEDYTEIRVNNKENGNLNNNLKTNELKPKLLMVCNHQSTADVPLMMSAFTSHSKYTLLWIMEDVFKYTNFGLVSVTHKDYFISTKKYAKQDATKHCLLYESTLKNLIVLFPEGGFRYKRLPSSQRYASTKGKRQLENVTWPHHGAFNDLNVDQLQLTHLIDLTIIYPQLNNPLSILDICTGNEQPIVYFYYRIFERNRTTTFNEEWLDKLWIEKEEIIDQFYLNPQQFLANNSKFTRIVSLNWYKLIAIHLFYILATYSFLLCFRFIYTSLTSFM